jgi:2-polyprenyl-3-methyl-5-hydroxy-6-metoxy-1,4-benzoquinol methylase
MNLTSRSLQSELIDQPGLPASDIAQNMAELNTINHWLGGHRITTAGFAALAGPHKKIHVCEIGCGGGDNLKAIANWCKRKGIELHATGVDINEQCIDFAQKNSQDFSGMHWICSDYRKAAIQNKPDIIFSSLFCHHFTNGELEDQLRWMHEHSTLGFFINDLHRHWLAYHSIRFLTKGFSKSYLVKNDAPLSVARGFRKQEWQHLLDKSNLSGGTVQWKWAFRFLVVVNKKERKSA